MAEGDQDVLDRYMPPITPREGLPSVSIPEAKEVNKGTAQDLLKAIRLINGTKDRAVRSQSAPLSRENWVARVTSNPQVEGGLNLTFQYTDVYGKHTSVVYLGPDDTFQYRGNDDSVNHPLSQTAADFLLSVLPRSEK